MSIPLWTLVVGALLTVLSKAPAMRAMIRQPTGYDNHHPRAQQAALTGAGARAIAAHQNTFEAFPIFAAGVIVAESFAPDHIMVAVMSVAFILFRLLYIGLYVADKATWRSIVWALGYFASMGLLLSPLWAV